VVVLLRTMSRNVKLQIFLDAGVYNFVRQYQRENRCPSESFAVYRILKEHFTQANIDTNPVANKLTEGILKRDEKIKQLENKIEDFKNAIKIYSKQKQEVDEE